MAEAQGRRAWPHVVWKILSLLSIVLLAGPCLRAQEDAKELLRLAEPDIPVPNGGGWRVDPQTGKLAVAVNIGRMPGEISFPVSFVLQGAYQTRVEAAQLYNGTLEGGGLRFGIDTTMAGIGVYGGPIGAFAAGAFFVGEPSAISAAQNSPGGVGNLSSQNLAIVAKRSIKQESNNRSSILFAADYNPLLNDFPNA